MLKFPFIPKYNPYANPVKEFEKRLSKHKDGDDITHLTEVLDHPKCDKKAISDMLGRLFSFYHMPYQVESALDAVFHHTASRTDMNSSVFEQALNLAIANKTAMPEDYKAHLVAAVLKYTPKEEPKHDSNPWLDKAIRISVKHNAHYLLPAIFNHDDCKTADMLNCANLLLDEKVVLVEERNNILSLKHIFEHKKCDQSTIVNILDLVRTKQGAATLGWILEQSQWLKDDTKIKDIHIHLLMEKIIDDEDEKSLSAVLDSYKGADQVLYCILLHTESYIIDQDLCLRLVRSAQMHSTKNEAPTTSEFLSELYAYTLDCDSEDNNYWHMVMDIYDEPIVKCSNSFNAQSFFEAMAEKKLPAVKVLRDWGAVAKQENHAPCLTAAFKSLQSGNILDAAVYLKEIENNRYDEERSGRLTGTEKAQIRFAIEKADPENAQTLELYLKHLVYGG